MLFSVIIPVYNVEKYLRECLDSVLNQTFSDWEAVCVNDGSTDGSAGILEEYSAKDERFRVIEQTNAGLSAARNTGMENAKGDYVLFLDSDDWLELNALKILAGNLAGGDMVCFTGRRYLEAGKRYCPSDQLEERQYQSGMNYYNENALRCRDFAFVCVVLRAYKHSFLVENDLRFKEGIFHEDNEFTPRAITLAKSIAACQNSYYQRRIRSGSITSSVNSKRPMDIIVGMKSLNKFSLDYSGKTRVALDTYIANTINFACKLSSRTDKASQNHFKEALNNEPWIKGALLNASKPKFIIEGILLTILPRQLFRIHKGLMLFNPHK